MADNGSSRKATCCSKNSSSTERLGVEFVLPITSVAKMEACPSETTSTSRAVTSIGDVQSFSRMPSQRRRRLWTLAARAAARRENFSHEKEPLSACSGVLKNHAETSTQSSSFLKPGTVRTQDSGISSMDYVTSRDANSPNSEEAGFRQRASLSLTASEHSQAVSTQPHSQTPRPQTDAARLHCPTLSTAVRTKIVVSGECEGDDTHPGSTLRYANHCTSYVPDWARRNWSSAPRPLISRQRSSLEVGYDPAPDWAASMETLNMQSSLYQQNRRLFYGRYGRASCPKTPTYYDHPNPPVTTIHMEEEEGEGETEPSMDNPSVTGDVDHLRRRRFDTLPQPCWCERPPPPHTHTCSFRPPPLACRTGSSMLSPFFHCSACPYRTLEPAYFMPPYQCDLPQRHIRRRMLKRMSSEPTPPTWMSEEGSTPPKRRAPPPQPPEFASPPPLPRRAAKSEASQYGYTEQRIISSTPKTDILILEPDSCGSAAWGRRPPMLQEGLRRGCSVDEAYYSPRWGRQSSFVSDPLAEGYRPTRRPMTASYPMTHVYDQGDPRDWYTCSRRRGNDSAPSRLGVMPHFYNPNFPGSSSVLRPRSCRAVRTTSCFPTSPRGSQLLRPRSVSGSRPYPSGIRPGHRHFNYATRSNTSSLESSEATQSEHTKTAPPWQIGVSAITPPLFARRVSSARQTTDRSVGGSNDSDLCLESRRRRQHAVSLQPTSPTSPSASVPAYLSEQDVKWKRKSFRRANGYDAADFIDRLPSSMLDDTEHLPLRRQTSVAGTRQADEVSVTTHTAEAPNVRDDLRDLEACVKRSEKERESEEAKADDDEDIDQIIASLTCPKLTTSSSSINPSRSSYPLGSSRPGATADTSVGELATLGFTNRNDYWEHSAFGRSRLTAILLSVIATVCLLYSLVATTWVYTGHPGNVTRRGLWRKCSMENGSCEITLPFLSETDGWQGGATCILVVAIMISFLGTGLAIFGHSGSDLVKRLYYFHSSGEIFFLAGFTTFLSFGIYRSYASMNLLNLRQTNPPSAFTTTSDQSPLASLPQPIRFGAADYTGWTAGVVFFAAAFALLIDEFIHELAKLGQSRWPCLARCLRCCAIRVTTFNRRLRTAQRSLAARCSSKSSRQHRQQHRQKSTSTTSSVTASATTRDRSGQTSGVVFSYKPTTGSSLATQRRRRRWRQRRQ